ncbi:hypothetical protein ACH4U3_03835 [Streptomyces griseoruber]|uniref:hypothetical protein n=1 Tax=Streptomyces griseoruber TaxID=1943 RepID=UPI003795C79C
MLRNTRRTARLVCRHLRLCLGKGTLEAAKVAQRVIHHFDTCPQRTLGVVALSTAQAEAIEEAVQKARAARPDLDHHFTEGRHDEGPGA